MGDNFPTQRDPGNATGIPESFFPIIWEEFATLNTKPPRPAISKSECSWLDGFMPLGPSNLRTLYGAGDVLFTAGAGRTIIWAQSYNIQDTSYHVVLEDDGSLFQVNSSTGMSVNIGAPGTIQSPSTRQGFSQWGSQYLILAKDQSNGYWLWDGNNLFTAGTFGPVVNVDNGGLNYSSQPSFIVQDQTGVVSNGAFEATIDNGSITQVTVTNPGAGFTVESIVAIAVQGGGSDDQAIFAHIDQTAQQTQGGVDEVIIVNNGNGYTGRAFAVFTGGGGSGAQGSLSIVNGTITGVAIVNPGVGYTSAPTITVTDPGIPGTPSIPGGTGFSANATLKFGMITGIGILNGGSGYTTPPTIQILGNGTGAAAQALIQGGAVVQVFMTNMGSGYSEAIAVAQGGNNAANVTPMLMPFGVSGTAVETYQQRVWVSNGSAVSNTPPKNRTLYSSPQSPVDFGDGGGGFSAFDSFVRIGYHSLKQANGFLYLVGDSSINYISNVQTTAPSSANTVAVATTTFSNQNTDPQEGSPWPSSVQVFNRNIVFANSIGIYSSIGGAAEKVSTGFDGFYGSVPLTGNTADYPSAVATLFNVPVYMLLVPIIDQFSGQQVNKLLMWDGKRLFTSAQDRNLTYIWTQEINSVLVAWGTDGTQIFPILQNPSVNFTKVVQSKLYSDPGYFLTKSSRSLSGIINSYTLDEDVLITIDNETALGTGNASVSVTPALGGFVIVNNVDATVSIINNVGQTVTIGAPGLDVFGPEPVGQNGRLVGFTIQTNASNLAMLSLMLSEQAYATNL